MKERTVCLVVAVIGAVSALGSGVADARAIDPPPGARVVTPGALCVQAEAGDVGQTTTGAGMVCAKAAGDQRLRWRGLDSSTHRLVGSVDRLYRAYFDRAADAEGFAYWINLRIDGVPLAAISESFHASREFPVFPAIGPSPFVPWVYVNVLGREPDAEGLGYWRDLLDRREITEAQMMLFFSQSSEFRVRTGTI